jgi:hypothetical protein
MNIIQEQREEIIHDNNTAQGELSEYLSKLRKTIDTVDIREPLSGDLDFAILRELGLSNIKNILLPEGEITNITNLPEGLLKLVCPKNLLISLDNIPGSLLHLEIPHNYLKSIDISYLDELTTLIISHNHFSIIENLPSKIVELYCENNKLTTIDLVGLVDLHKLNVSNNRITIIENLPENIIDFRMENNPSIEFRNSPSAVSTIEKSTKVLNETNTKQSIDFNESIHKYFALKSDYETKLRNARKKAFQSTTSKKIGKKRAMEVKAACVNCKRAVGTSFYRKDERYYALCGDSKAPCSLNIEIYSGNFSPKIDLLYTFKELVDESKDNIIRQKMDTLFAYVSEKKAAEDYKKAIEEYNLDNQMFKELFEIYTEQYHSINNLELLQKRRNFVFHAIERIRELLAEYEKTNNTELLKAAVQIQINDLYPIVRNMRKEHMEIIRSDSTAKAPQFYLFKNDVALSKLEHTFGEQPRVIRFRKG